MTGPGPTTSAQRVSHADRSAIIADCLATFNRYLVNADHHPERFTDCFTPDVLWVRPGGAMQGHAQMQAFMDAAGEEQRRAGGNRDLTRHLLTTANIEVAGPQSAQGLFYALVYRVRGAGAALPQAMCEPELLVEYSSHFVPFEGEWRINRHEARHVLREAVHG